MTFAKSSGCQWLSLAAPFPALILGVNLMRHHHIPASIWEQNLFAGILLTTVCVGMLWVKVPKPKSLWWGIAGVLAIVLLLLTFTDTGLEGVHRWVKLGPLRLHAGAVALPVLILVLGKTQDCASQKRSRWLLVLLTFGGLGLLALQPDAAQATAYAGAVLAMLAFYRQPPRWIWLVVLLTVVAVVWTWMRADPLLPVRHVEGIVGLAAERSVFWHLASLLSLGLLPLPFLLDRAAGRVSPKALALGIYFLLTLFASWAGTFPVPLLGYGLSPIIGYYIALAWLVTRRTKPRPSHS